MHSGHHHHSHHHGCAGQSSGPQVFYGYCHESGRMRMMDYSDYMRNMQTGYSNIYQGPATMMQPMIDAMTGMMSGSVAPARPGQGRGYHQHHAHHCHDCSCECCIRCADLVEYARCGEVRQIPITFENDSRRECAVKLQLGAFATESGLEPGWQATLSETEFKLPPCGEKTVVLAVPVDCAKLGPPHQDDERKAAAVDSCKVLYATLRAEGCTVRPLVIAVAVLPAHCGAHHAGCGCDCCCN